MTTIVQIFAKCPIAGKVKTRLARSLGEYEACEVYKKLLFRTFKSIENLNDNFTVQLWIDDYNCIFFKKNYFNNSKEVFEQKGKNLGDKMYNAIRYGLLTADKVILIGTDCPSITHKHYVKLNTLLDKNEVAIIPATDGGFVLFGTTKINKKWFEMEYSTDKVMQQTESALKKTQTKFIATKPLRDLDLYQDYRWCLENNLL